MSGNWELIELPNKVANGAERGKRQDTDEPESEKQRAYRNQKKIERVKGVEFVGTRIRGISEEN